MCQENDQFSPLRSEMSGLVSGLTLERWATFHIAADINIGLTK